MKRVRQVFSLLIAGILIFGMATAVSAAPATTTRNLIQDGIVFGQFPQLNNNIGGINQDIERDMRSTLFLKSDPGMFNNYAAMSRVGLISHEWTIDGDFARLTVTFNARFSAAANRVVSFSYFINTATNTRIANEAAFNAAIAARGAAAPAAPAPPPITRQERVDAMLAVWRAMPIVTNEAGYINLTRYADAVNGRIGLNATTGHVQLTVRHEGYTYDSFFPFDIHPNLFDYSQNALLDAPIYIDGTDIWVHATLVYPVLQGRPLVDENNIVWLRSR